MLSPYAAVQVNTASLPAFNEGWSPFALRYASQTVTDTTSELGFRVKQDFARDGALFTVGGRLAWGYNFNTTEQATAGFGLAGVELHRLRRVAGAKLGPRQRRRQRGDRKRRQNGFPLCSA